MVVLSESEQSQDLSETTFSDVSKSEIRKGDLDELPPSYEPRQATLGSPGGSASGSTSLPTNFQPNHKPTNYLSLIRKDRPIKGTFIVDPLLEIPPSLLPPLEKNETEEDRKNLRLEAKDGAIDVEIWLVGEDAPAGLLETERHEKRSVTKKRTTLSILSRDGSVTAKLRTPDAASTERNPFHLTAMSKDGAVTLYLPRSFHGPLTIEIHDGAIVMSDAVTENLTTFSEVKGIRKCFVGNFSASGWSSGEEAGGWTGDVVEVVAHDGSIRIRYVDEVQPVGEKKPGFFSRMFGL